MHIYGYTAHVATYMLPQPLLGTVVTNICSHGSYRNTSKRQTHQHFKSDVGKLTFMLKSKQVLRVLLGWDQRFQLWYSVHSTLAWSSVIIEGKAWVARAGVGTGHIGTELLAIAIATFIYVYKWKKLEWSAFSHADTKHQVHWINSTRNREVTQHSSYRLTAKLVGVQIQLVNHVSAQKECIFSTSTSVSRSYKQIIIDWSSAQWYMIRRPNQSL